jgi:predicted dehydrogenase
MTRLGFIGTGGVADVHRKAIELVDGATLGAVYDIDSARCSAMAGQGQARVCATVDELLDNSDAIYILTPPHTHRELVMRALEAGKHVLCEKPLAISLEDGRRMRDAAAAADVEFMIAFSMRYRESYQRLKSIYDSGSLGTPLTFWFQRMFGGGGYDPNNWRYRPESQSGMSIESLSHQIDLVRWIIGEVETVYARVIASHSELPGVDDNIHAVFGLDNGVTATLHVSWSSHLQFNTTGINGTDGTVRIWGAGGADHDTMYQHFRGATAEEQTVLGEKYDEQIMANECRGFLELIERRESGSAGVSCPGIDDGLRALEISHAMLTSSRENRVVDVSGSVPQA